MNTSCLLCGVGGQGTILAAKLIAYAAMKNGYDVRTSETIGMAQRGGSVVSHVRIGKDCHAPLISRGQADVILAFELLEAYRALPYLKKGGKIIVNAQQIDPMPVITGAMEYPADIAAKLSAVADVTVADALSAAKEAGNAKAVNVVLIGVLAKVSEIPYEKWVETLKTTVPPKFLDINLKAFDIGYNL